MKNLKKSVLFAFALIATFAFAGNVSAMTPTLSLSNTGNNSVFVSVNGDANSSVTLYYNSNNYGYSMQNSLLGYTNYNGYFSTTLSTSNYNIASGTSVYVIVNGQQSASVSWPYNTYYGGNNYNNQYGLIVSNLNLSVGNSITMNSPTGSGLYVSNNSNSAVVSVNNMNSSNNVPGCVNGAMYSTINGQYCYNYQNYNQNYNYNSNSVTLTALTSGSASVTLCQSGNSNSCSVISVYVTGVVNNGSVLGATTCGFYRTLRFGMSGSDVSCLKTMLGNKGYLTNYDYSSYFDLQTKNAVMLFQQDNYLFVDGVAGRRTFNLLGN